MRFTSGCRSRDVYRLRDSATLSKPSRVEAIPRGVVVIERVEEVVRRVVRLGLPGVVGLEPETNHEGVDEARRQLLAED